MSVENHPLQTGRESVANQSIQLHSVAEACRLLGGMGRTWFYGEVAAKRIRTVKLGTRTLVSNSELRRYIAVAAQAKSR
jgi:excisionase family DNA binding protein